MADCNLKPHGGWGGGVGVEDTLKKIPLPWNFIVGMSV